MPTELRFCRNCGYRLGEGPAEYTETVRFQNGVHGGMAGNVATALPGAYGPFGPANAQAQVARVAAGQIRRRRRRFGGISWIFLALILFFVTGGIFSNFVPRFPRINVGGGRPSVQRSFVGVNSFTSTDGGVTFGDVEPPGSPADKAGLVGGDVITVFDGQQVTDEHQMMELLIATPIGKTVDVAFIRDGEIKTRKLTTISQNDFDQLTRAFRNRPEGQGQLGIDDYKRVGVPGTKLYGAQVTVDPRMAAALAGLKNGDIIIEFDHTPIRTAEELVARIHRALPYTTIDVVIMRGSEELKIPVKVARR